MGREPIMTDSASPDATFRNHGMDGSSVRTRLVDVVGQDAEIVRSTL